MPKLGRRPWLLEINSGPDLSLYGARLHHELDALLADTLHVVNKWLYGGNPSGGADASLDRKAEHAADLPTTTFNSNSEPGYCCVLRRGAEPRAELERFKRSINAVGKFAYALHGSAGAPVRGVQAKAMAIRDAAQQMRDAAALLRGGHATPDVEYPSR